MSKRYQQSQMLNLGGLIVQVCLNKLMLIYLQIKFEAILSVVTVEEVSCWGWRKGERSIDSGVNCSRAISFKYLLGNCISLK